MTEKKDRDRVMAEITLEHVLRLATVTSNEELDRLLAMSPVYNYATYQVLALAEMEDPRTVMGNAD